MADKVQMDPSKLQQINSALSDTSENIQTQMSLMDSLSSEWNDFKLEIQDTAIASVNFFKNQAQQISTTISQLNAGTLSAQDFAQESGVLNVALATMSTKLTSLNTNFNGFNSSTLAGAQSIGILNTKVNTFIDTISKKVPIPFLDELKNVYSDINFTRDLESSLTSVMSVAGGFGEAGQPIQNIAEFISKLDIVTAQYTQSSSKLATTLGITSDEFNNYRAKIMELPTAYSGAVSSAEKLTSVNELTQKAFKVAAGSTGDFANTLDALKWQYEQFGKSNEDVLSLFSKTFELSNMLGVRFNDLQSPIKTASEAFADFGDNTNSAANVVSSLFKNLKDSGLGIRPTTDAINSITSSIQNLSIGSSAFISASSGGPGGLRGAFEIQELLAQGKLEEVVNKMKQSYMQQVGGNIVSRAEAAQSETAAAQYMKQLAFLQSGPYGSLVNKMGSADAVMKAMAGGPISEALDKNKAYEEVSGIGQTMIERRQDIVLDEYNKMAEATSSGRLARGGMFRPALGEVAQGTEAGSLLRESIIERGMQGLNLSDTISTKEVNAQAMVDLAKTQLDTAKIIAGAMKEIMNNSSADQAAKQAERLNYQAQNASFREAANRGIQLTEPTSVLGQRIDNSPVPVTIADGSVITVKFVNFPDNSGITNREMTSQATIGAGNK
jgi:hypothetical protein